LIQPELGELHGTLNVEMHDDDPATLVWVNASDSVSWSINFAQPGTYKVSATYASGAPHDYAMALELDDKHVTGVRVNPTGGPKKFETTNAGVITVTSAGVHTLKAHPQNPKRWRGIRLRSIQLEPVSE